MKASGTFKFQGVNSGAGWYRFAKISKESNGASGNSVLFFIKTYFNNSVNMSVTGLLNNSYENSNFVILGKSIRSFTISNIRYVVDKSNDCSYLEIYYNESVPNGISIELIGSKVSDREWNLLDTLEKTEETVDGIILRSSINLKTGENCVVTNSAFVYKDFDLTVTADKPTAISGAPDDRNYFFNIQYVQTSPEVHIYWSNGWSILSKSSPRVIVRFFKYPI